MKIKFLKPFRFIGNDPDDGSDDTVPVGHTVDLENDESTQWLIDNGFAERLEVTTHDEAFCQSVESCVSIADDGFVPATNVKFPKEHQEQRDKFTEFMEAVNTVSKDEGFMLQTTRGDGVVDSDVATVIEKHGRLQVWKVDYVYRRAGAFYFDTCEHAYSSITKHRSAWQTIYDYKWGKE